MMTQMCCVQKNCLLPESCFSLLEPLFRHFDILPEPEARYSGFTSRIRGRHEDVPEGPEELGVLAVEAILVVRSAGKLFARGACRNKQHIRLMLIYKVHNGDLADVPHVASELSEREAMLGHRQGMLIDLGDDSDHVCRQASPRKLDCCDAVAAADAEDFKSPGGREVTQTGHIVI